MFDILFLLAIGLGIFLFARMLDASTSQPHASLSCNEKKEPHDWEENSVTTGDGTKIYLGMQCKKCKRRTGKF